MAAAPFPPGEWTVVRSKRATQATKRQPSPPQPTMDQRSFEFVHDEQTKLNRNEADNVASYVNRALYKEGISNVRIERIRCTDTRRILSVTTPTSTLHDLLQHRDTVLRAARLADSSTADVVPQQRWKWIQIHNISLARYMGKTRDGGLVKLREELEAENSGMHMPAEIRWLGGAKVRARFQEKKEGASSVAAVLGEATFGRLCKGGVRLLRRRYEVDAFEEARRPDAFCSRCSGWKHIAPHYLTAGPRCALCAKDHLTTDHRCPVEGCRVGKGHPCPHGAAKCTNCGGAHGARADACAAKREARLSARGWRSTPPPRRERGAAAPEAPVDETPTAQEGAEEGGTEVEAQEKGGVGPGGGGNGDGGVGVLGSGLFFSFLFFFWCGCGFSFGGHGG